MIGQSMINVNSGGRGRLSGISAALFLLAFFLEQFDPASAREDVVIDFVGSRVFDHSGLEAIDTLAERYLNAGKALHLVHLSGQCKQLLRKTGDLVEVNVIEDPRYFIAEDALA